MTKMTKAKAKTDLAALRADGNFTNFLEGHSYPCIQNGNTFTLMDEDRMGFSTNEELFAEYFELQEED